MNGHNGFVIKKAYRIFLILQMIVSVSFSQILPLDTIMYNGDPNNLINIVVLGDGYTASQSSKFLKDVESFKNSMFTQEPFSNYKEYFNVYAITTVSQDSGATHPYSAPDCYSANPLVPLNIAITYFDSRFDSYGIHRLIVPTKFNELFSVLTDNFPNYDQVYVLVNTPYFGGAGGSIAIATMHPITNEIAIHETGHSFAGLADEYWAGSQYAAEKINMTQQSDPSLVKWKNWINHLGVGVYPFSEDPSWYKPHLMCKMSILNEPFCSVCTEGIIERIHSLVNPVSNYSPALNISFPKDSSQLFDVSLIRPIPDALKTSWTLNGNTLSTNTDSFLLAANYLSPGTHQLKFSVTDTNLLLRVDAHQSLHINTLLWTLDVTDVTVNLKNILASETNISIYPNPTSDLLSIEMETDKTSRFDASLFDVLGRELYSSKNKSKTSAGKLEIPEVKSLKPGVYFLKIYVDGNVITRQIVKE